MWRRTGAWIVGTLALAFGACSDTAEERCEAAVEKVEDCGFEYEPDVCEDKANRCWVECAGAASCDDLGFDDDAPRPPKLAQCQYRCLETAHCEDDGRPLQGRWLCDGDNDCVDGSDERDCEYFACMDGLAVDSDSQCDEYEDCSDGSDEVDCP